MKKILISIALIISLTTYAQAPFEGTITYSLNIKGEASIEEKEKLPDEVIAYFKDGKMRFDVISPEFDLHIITNEVDKEATFMMELKSEITMKFALKTSTNELKKEFDVEDDQQIRHTRETKQIAGYKCKKVVVDTEDGEVYAYVSEELNAQNLNWLLDDDIKGTLLEFIINDNDKSEGIILRAKEVKKTSIPDAKFKVPSDYMVISTEGLKGMFGEDGLF